MSKSWLFEYGYRVEDDHEGKKQFVLMKRQVRRTTGEADAEPPWQDIARTHTYFFCSEILAALRIGG